MNIFDGFRTSHEISKIDAIPDDIIKAMMPEDRIMAHKKNSLDPDNPVIRGTSQNPDVFFQAREAANTYYDNVPEIVQDVMDEFYSIQAEDMTCLTILDIQKQKELQLSWDLVKDQSMKLWRKW